MIKLRVFSSGSKGNCYAFDDGESKLLIECGISWKEIQRNLDFNTSDIVACLCSHSHKDHCKSINDVMKAGIEVYTSQGTATSLGISHHRLNIVEEGKQFDVGCFAVLPFPTEHDAMGSLGFLIYHKPTKTRTLFATDTYFIRNRFNGLNFLIIECNYCREILEENVKAGRINESLKNRILESHFSLENLKGFLKANDLSQVKKIVLIHLSDGNSNAAQMISEIHELTKKDTVIAEPGKVINLDLYPF